MISEADVLINYDAYVWPLPGGDMDCGCTVTRPRAWHRAPRSRQWQQLQRGGELGTVTDDGAIVITHTAIVPRTSQLIWNIF